MNPNNKILRNKTTKHHSFPTLITICSRLQLSVPLSRKVYYISNVHIAVVRYQGKSMQHALEGAATRCKALPYIILVAKIKFRRQAL